MQTVSEVHLQTNMLTGQLPVEWAEEGRWPNLTILELYNNVLSGTIPADWGFANATPSLTEL